MATYDAITLAITAPPDLVSNVTGGILMAFTPPRGKVRTMDRELPGIGDMVHFLGPAAKIYKAAIRLESTTFDGLEAKDEAWSGADGCICTVTITPRSGTSDSNRSSQTLTNMLAALSDVSPPVSSGDLFSRVLVFEFKKLTPIGVP